MHRVDAFQRTSEPADSHPALSRLLKPHITLVAHLKVYCIGVPEVFVEHAAGGTKRDQALGYVHMNHLTRSVEVTMKILSKNKRV